MSHSAQPDERAMAEETEQKKTEIIQSIDEMRSESRIVNLNTALITIMAEN